MATQDDFDWLYGGARPQAPADETQVQPLGGGTGTPLTHPGDGASAQPRQPLPPRPEPVSIAPAPPRRPNVAGRPGSAPSEVSFGSTSARPPRKKRRAWPWVAGVAATLAVAFLAFLVIVPMAAWGKVAKVNDVPTGQRPAEQPGSTFLLVGNDKRGDLAPAEADRLGVDHETPGDRTDTMLLLHVPKTGKPVLISLPRDSYLAIPGHKKNKLNAAYSLGGAPLLVKTIEQNTGVRIDGYLEVGFGGFARVVDAIGGVDVCVSKEIPGSARIPEGIKPGCQHLDTPHALWFVRNRSNRDGQDLGRVKRQRMFLASAIKGVMSPTTFLNPVRYQKTATAFSQAIAVGQDTQLADMITMARGMSEISKGNGYSLMVPIESANARTSAGSSVLWDRDKAPALFAMLAKGDTTGVEKFVK